MILNHSREGGTMSTSIEDSITIRAPRSTVFGALTEAQRLERWLATAVESDPRTGGRFRYSFEFEDASRNNVQEGEYLEVVADERLAVPWVFPFSPKQTRVEYTLAGDGDETEVTFRHTGFESGEPWNQARERFVGGWRMFLEGLKAHVEQGADQRPLGMK
jgi:uncharacterized protein YndB with AHSA1/START domain